MLTLKQACTPRPVVFDPQKRDTVLDLSDLVSGRISPAEFFDENYVTEGMRELLRQAFRRLEGKSDQGVFQLRQAMGGGKTHNLIALGLLAVHPEYRKAVMGGFHDPDPSLGPVKVIAFSGRESDAPFGVWGALAEQLGKRELFDDLYSPLRAPGQRAWENLLSGERLLILLDELPPYFVSAASVQIGNSDLARVTATALANLLIAIGRPGCERVALVITDLAGAYREGSTQIAEALEDLRHETGRSALSLEPVRLNSDELYHILRRRIFEALPDDEQIGEVAQGYADALRKAKQMDMTTESPEEFAARVMSSYPFHPGIRDLYARFRENPGFQQTRGLIRLMRMVTANLWTSSKAERSYLIGAHDVDLNDQQIRAEVNQINSTLENAVAHDIAAEGESVAEQMDSDYESDDATDTARLILMASLANVPNAVLGLSIPEAIAYLTEPDRDVVRLKNDVLPTLSTRAWYMHATRDGKLYFRNVENVNAKLESYVRSCTDEQAMTELRRRLEQLFAPQQRDVYQRLQILPGLDEIQLDQDRVTLAIVRPATGDLDPALRQFYEQATFKNRLAILTGPRNTYAQLVDVGKRLRGIEQIIADMRAEGSPDSDPQLIQAGELRDRIVQNFHSAVRETFTTLWYPTVAGLLKADFQMRFQANRYDGEEQIRQLLAEKQKWTNDFGESFRLKVEQRLFTQKSMPWSEIKRRAATTPAWQWYLPSALDDLKAQCLFQDAWREEGGYVDKGPFDQPQTRVDIRVVSRDEDTGEALLRLQPVYGDRIYWDEGSEVSTASALLDGNELKTSSMRVSFLCVDSTSIHETGAATIWTNTVTLKFRFFQQGESRMLELRAAPLADIVYTTDGSDPKLSGARYDGPFAVPRSATLVLAYAERDGISSEVLRVPVDWEKDETVKVDPLLPARLNRRFATRSTSETYEWLQLAERRHARVRSPRLTVGGTGGVRRWLELATSEDLVLTPQRIDSILQVLREEGPDLSVQLEATALEFARGQDLLEWVAEVKTELKPGEVIQGT